MHQQTIHSIITLLASSGAGGTLSFTSPSSEPPHPQRRERSAPYSYPLAHDINPQYFTCYFQVTQKLKPGRTRSGEEAHIIATAVSPTLAPRR